MSSVMNFVKNSGIKDVFVLDNASDDATVHYLSRYYPKLRCEVLEKKQSLAFCLNYAIPRARQPYVIYLEFGFHDIALNLDHMQRDLKDPAVFGMGLNEKTMSDDELFFYRGQFKGGFFQLKSEKLISDKQQLVHFWSRAFCLKRDVFTMLGACSELFPSQSTLFDLAYRVQKREFYILFDASQSLFYFEGMTRNLRFPSFLNFLFFWAYNRSLWRWLLHVLLLLLSWIFFIIPLQRASARALFNFFKVRYYRRHFLLKIY